jgi:cytochrome c oxidase cbb3-type subunit 1
MSQATQPAAQAAPPDDIAISCRLPLLILFVSAAVWLVIGSVFALIASIKFHSPNFLADCTWLSYGRVRPAGLNSFLYGFCVQAGLGVTFWILARLGRATLAQAWLAAAGAKFWNLGVTVGVLGILTGDSTGFENLDMPRYAAVIMSLGYLMAGLSAALTFHNRRQLALAPPQWFLLAALFWFPWIYSTANLLLVAFPVRGVAQSVIGWWYSNNLHVVWFGLVGLAAVFYFVPALTESRAASVESGSAPIPRSTLDTRHFQSRYLALFTFWTLILFGSWGGIPASAPVPAWMPALSTSASVLTLVPMLAAILTVCRTLGRPVSSSSSPVPSLRFIGFGLVALIVATMLNAAAALPEVNQVLGFTWFTPALLQLNLYGFFAMTLFGAIYDIVPRITGVDMPSPKLVRAHFWVAAAGIVLCVVPLTLSGVVQGLQLQNANVAFLETAKATLPFLRISTVGDLLIGVGHVFFLANLAGVVTQFCRARATKAYLAATAQIQPAEART